MMNCNWMVVKANEGRKVLVERFGYSRTNVDAMDLKEIESKAKSLGYVFQKRNNHGVA